MPGFDAGIEVGGTTHRKKIADPLTDNERELALKAWARAIPVDSRKWGNLVLEAYDGRVREIAELNRRLDAIEGFLEKQGYSPLDIDGIMGRSLS